MATLSRRISRLLSIGVLMVVAGLAWAQPAASYPNKPVRLIVPFLPGSSSDAVARTFADRFARDLGQTFVIDNRGGIIGATAAARVTPDGYTLLVNTGMYLVNHWLDPNLPFDSIRDLTPISMLARGNWMLVVHPAFPANTLQEFTNYARANPGKINVSTVGSIGVLIYQMFMKATGTKITLVNYKGGPQPLIDVATARIDGVLTGVANVSTFVTTGKMKGLAIAGAQRNPALPNVPTFAEAGLKNFEPFVWWALIAPSKTPRYIIEKMNAEVRKAQQVPEVIAALAKLPSNPYLSTAAEAETFVRTEADRLRTLIKESGLKAGDN